MPALIPLLFLAISVKQDHTPLRNGCSGEAETIVNLPAGTEVDIRFAMLSGATPCYKVAAKIDGKTLTGYVAASALDGLDAFQKGVRDAPQVDAAQVMDTVRPAVASVTVTGSGKLVALLNQTMSLMDSGQPEKAFELIQPVASTSKEPGVLTIAGAAAWRADDSAKALEYWRAALALQPNPPLEALYKRVEKESSNDKSSARLYGIRVALRYEQGAIEVDAARGMVAALDQEFARISAELGCSAQERIVAIAQSPDAYRKSTDAAEWSGGQYDGRIRVPVAPAASGQSQAVDALLRRTLAHEITHACLSMMGQWPAWLQEGLAQKLSGDVVSPQLREKLKEWGKEGKLPKLANLGQDWSRLDTAHAVVAYGLSLQAVDAFYDTYGIDGVRNLLRSPERLGAVAADLDSRLGL